MSHSPVNADVGPHQKTTLLRSLSLWQVTLYGLGVTIGAGIYVLVGATAGQAGIHAPISFFVAAIVMAFSAMSYAEFAGRVPLSDGSAAYVREGFGSDTIGLIVGLAVVFAGLVSAAAISIGSAGYIREFVDLPQPLLTLIVVLLMGAIASWGIAESVTFASIFTIVEVGALVAVVFFGIGAKPELLHELPRIFPITLDVGIWMAIAGAGLLAFFAFIGFEDIVTLAEETKNAEQVLPKAIFLTVGLAALLYFFVSAVAVLSVPLDALSRSRAPLSYVFSQSTGQSPAVISAIAIFATANGVIIQMIMASRVLYGLGNKGSLPAVFARVNARTRTPLFSTLVVTTAILILALALPLQSLAEMTSSVVLGVFVLINLALIRLKLVDERARDDIFTVPIWVPIAGMLSCLGLLAVGWL